MYVVRHSSPLFSHHSRYLGTISAAARYFLYPQLPCLDLHKSSALTRSSSYESTTIANVKSENEDLHFFLPPKNCSANFSTQHLPSDLVIDVFVNKDPPPTLPSLLSYSPHQRDVFHLHPIHWPTNPPSTLQFRSHLAFAFGNDRHQQWARAHYCRQRFTGPWGFLCTKRLEILNTAIDDERDALKDIVVIGELAVLELGRNKLAVHRHLKRTAAPDEALDLHDRKSTNRKRTAYARPLQQGKTGWSHPRDV